MELPNSLPVLEERQLAPLQHEVAPVQVRELIHDPLVQQEQLPQFVTLEVPIALPQGIPRQDEQLQLNNLQDAQVIMQEAQLLEPALNNTPKQQSALQDVACLDEVPISLPQRVPLNIQEQVRNLPNQEEVQLQEAPFVEVPMLEEVQIPQRVSLNVQDEQILQLNNLPNQEAEPLQEAPLVEVPMLEEVPVQPLETPQQTAPRRSFASGRVVSVHFECHSRDEDLARMRTELEAWPRGLDGGEDCCPPLLHAVVKEHPRCVAFLLEMGADVNKEYGPLGETPLSSSVTRSTPELARLLLSRDSSGVNARSSLTKEPPLVRAIKHGNTETVRLLLEHGARPDVCAIRNDEKVPAVFLAVQLGHETMVRLLLDHGASLHGHAHFDKHNALFKHVQFAVSEGQVESLRALCLHGALRELRKVTLYPNLSRSIHCNFPIVCVLLRNENPLEVSLRTLDMLCEFGFNFWQCDKHDKEAWHKAEKLAGNNEFAKLLTYKMRRLRTRPLSLKMLCRLRLQEVMGRHFVSSARQLQIPETLYPFLLFENV